MRDPDGLALSPETVAAIGARRGARAARWHQVALWVIAALLAMGDFCAVRAGCFGLMHRRPLGRSKACA